MGCKDGTVDGGFSLQLIPFMTDAEPVLLYNPQWLQYCSCEEIMIYE